ncbi:MAG: ATP-dependent RNA helicase HrpA [Proteobacteria bacterium]|nr:ATP-dependent RNA helicase HrpA [Pseudomonadota bacterium]
MNQDSQLGSKIERCQGRDRHRFRLRAKRAVEISHRRKLESDIEQSISRRELRQSSVPALVYPEELPVSARRKEISEAIANHQVVILAGETGSGKTTQLPKICLDIGRGIDGLIGHTQPRRLAARTVANRIAEEMQSALGDIVGFQTRFQQSLGNRNLVKVMTDGILLAETQHDRWLNNYDTIILDEAHERSLNVDFLMGYLKQLLVRRRDLKLIVTSATLDVERIARYFADAPVITVKGRTYPVDVRYRPLLGEIDDADDISVNSGIRETIDELQKNGRGDVLVFLPGEREIREASSALRNLRDRFDIHALYARLSPAEQHRVFHQGAKPRIILSTNVAETSLTVPGIRYVIDTGTARISRYSWRAQIQRLPVEKISRASANQRAGRCGRTSPGICVRLFSLEDFESREEFTQPEIQRTNLAAVILQMANLGLGEAAKFPFIDPPDPRLIKDGYRLLIELQAVDNAKRLTAIGKQLARLPIDPRLGRMLIGAAEYDSLSEVLIIVSAIAVQDPRDRPFDKRQAADERHARFNDARSDFIALLNLWNYLDAQSEALSQVALRRRCIKEFINFKRWREWRDLYRQLRSALRDLDLKVNTNAADYDKIHRALLSGLLDHVGFKNEKGSFLGSKNRTFFPFPGSSLRNKPPKWVIAAEITETTRVYARTLAGIDPQWIERQAVHLLKQQVSEPHWQKSAARTGGFEKLTLNGLVIVARRLIDYAQVDRRTAREIFVRHALVYGEWDSRIPVVRQNQELIRSVEELETRTRRRDILIHEDELYAFYDERIPEHVCSGASFTKWSRQLDDIDVLRLSKQHLVRQDAPAITDGDYPKAWRQDGFELPLSYRFEPGTADDGVTLTVPIALLSRIDAARGDWLVPGLIEAKIVALLRALPKRLRKNFIPVPEFARAAVEAMTLFNGQLHEQLSAVLFRMTSVEVAKCEWNNDIEPHLLMHYVVRGVDGQTLASGRDLERLRKSLAEEFEARPVTATQQAFERQSVSGWEFGDLAALIQCQEEGFSIERFPALAEEGERVALRLFDDESVAAVNMRRGLRRLIMQALKKEVRYLEKNIPDITRLRMLFLPVGSAAQLTEDLILTAIQRAFIDQQELPNNEEGFAKLIAIGRDGLITEANKLAELLGRVLQAYTEVRGRLNRELPLSWIEAAKDIEVQLGGLVYPGFLSATPLKWLERLPRYLKAIEIRMSKLDITPDRDRQRRSEVEPLFLRIGQLKSEDLKFPDRLLDYKWKLEELRVSLFAQELGSIEKVSVKRLDKLWDEIH